MAARRTTTNSILKSTSTESKSSKSGSSANKANNSGNGKKLVKPGGTVVKSRYMQSAEKTSLSKSNSLTNESFAAPQRPSSPKPSGARPKVGTPPRRSVTPQVLATSLTSHETDTLLLGKSVLQSTFSDGHCFRPEFDISVIKEKAGVEKTPEPERNPEEEKSDIEMHTFILAYLTAKMQHNTAKLKAEAEAKLLQMMEEEEALRKEVQEKKRKHLLTEKNSVVNELLDLQIAVLTPVAEAAKQFTENYKSFATAVDTTRHQLPVKNFHVEENRREFLDKAEACLKDSEKLLLECTEGDHEDNSISLECLKNLKKTSNDMSQQVTGTFSDLLDLSSLSFRHMTHVQQTLEEEQLGTERILELYIPKH